MEKKEKINKKEKMKVITHKSKGNDSIIKVFYDEEIQEVHIKIDGDNFWNVVGYSDLEKALKKAENKCNPLGLVKCPQCGRKHNETQYSGFCCDACWSGY